MLERARKTQLPISEKLLHVCITRTFAVEIERGPLKNYELPTFHPPDYISRLLVIQVCSSNVGKVGRGDGKNTNLDD